MHRFPALPFINDVHLNEGIEKYPRLKDHTFSYGTAGVRADAKLLKSVVFRSAILACLRSLSVDGKTIGIVITASHNISTDNGLKIVDFNGCMLKISWEVYAEQIVHCLDSQIVQTLEQIAQEVNLKVREDLRPRICIGWDTRESSTVLKQAVIDGIKVMDAHYHEYGELTTPQLHYLTYVDNFEAESNAQDRAFVLEERYFDHFCSAFKVLVGEKQIKSSIVVDCANGVGAIQMANLLKHLPQLASQITLKNIDVKHYASLNHQSGADHVKTNQTLPANCSLKPMDRGCSFDGDADRIVYYYKDQNGFFHLLDGDKIATLMCVFLQELIRKTGLPIRLGLVQTAYANGASTQYISKILNLPVVCVSTGIKYLHQAAQQFDCGVYFEANGHGTVLFPENLLSKFETEKSQSPAQESALNMLSSFIKLLNQHAGDAITNLLAIEFVLLYKDWTVEHWDRLYTNFASRLLRVNVNDRSEFKTKDADRVLISPAGLQEKINQLKAKYARCRAFVRASGTEDVIRIYAEAATRAEADDCAFKIAELIHCEHQNSNLRKS